MGNENSTEELLKMNERLFKENIQLRNLNKELNQRLRDLGQPVEESEMISSFLGGTSEKIIRLLAETPRKLRFELAKDPNVKILQIIENNFDNEFKSDLSFGNEQINRLNWKFYEGKKIGVFGTWRKSNNEPHGNFGIIYQNCDDEDQAFFINDQNFSKFELNNLIKEYSREIIEDEEFNLNQELAEARSQYGKEFRDLRSKQSQNEIKSYRYNDRSLYRGEFKNGLRHGFGEEINVGGEYYYAGIWEQGKRTGNCMILRKMENGIHVFLGKSGKILGLSKIAGGEGAYIWPNNEKYVGEWVMGKREGTGKKYYPNGSLEYDGKWEDNQKNGKGKIYREEDNTLSYKGEWTGGLRDGEGSYYRSDGSRKYKGEWKKDSITGVGIFFRQDGKTKKYEGSLVNGLREGKGVSYYNTEKKKYDGLWRGDVKQGFGKFYDFDGETVIFEGEWENGEFVLGGIEDDATRLNDTEMSVIEV